MPLLNGYEVHVQCDGVTAEEYQAREYRDGGAVCWIAAEEGKNISLDVRRISAASDEPAKDWAVQLAIDGINISLHANVFHRFQPPHPISQAISRDARTGVLSLHPFGFAQRFPDRSSGGAQSVLGLGTIAVWVTEGRIMQDETLPRSLAEIKPGRAIHGGLDVSQAQGVTMSVAFRDGTAAPPLQWRGWKHEKPAGYFVFNYRSAQSLRQMGIISTSTNGGNSATTSVAIHSAEGVVKDGLSLNQTPPTSQAGTSPTSTAVHTSLASSVWLHEGFHAASLNPPPPVTASTTSE